MLACGRSKTTAFVYLEKIEKSLVRKMGLAPRKYLGAGLGAYFGYAFYHRRLNQLINDLSYHVARGSWAGSPFQIRARIFESEPKPRREVEIIIASFFDDLYAQIARSENGYWLEDTPYNILHADQLLGLFPSMRLIHIYRDPRDVLASYSRFEWGGDDLEATTRRLAGIYQRWFQMRETLPAGCFLEVSLEQLSNNPKTMLEKICAFLGFNFEEKLLSLPLDKVHSGRWQGEIPDTDKDFIEKWLGKYISGYGY